MTPTRPLFLALAAAAALVAGGCGSSDDNDTPASDEDQIREVFTTYTNAVADGEYDTACDQLSTASKRSMTLKLNSAKPAIQKLTGGKTVPGDCPGQLDLVLKTSAGGQTEKTRDDILEATRKAKIDKVTVNGETGSVQTTISLAGVEGVPAGTPPSQSLTPVRREDGDWKIDEQ